VFLHPYRKIVCGVARGGAGLGRLLQAVSDGQRRLRGMDIRSLTAEAAGGKRQMKKTARRRLS
jgi:hypothetical protein